MRVSLLVANIPFEVERALCSRMNKALGLRRSSARFLSGDTYRAMADQVFDETGSADPARLGPGTLVFVGVQRLREFESEVVPLVQGPIVLITHQGDLAIDDRYRDLAEHPKILHWFAQNCLLEHPKVTPLPIGLEDRWRHNNGELSDFRKLRGNRPAKPRIAHAFSLGTNLEKRLECYRSLKACAVADELEQPLNSRLYRNRVKEYMFVASPPGNGPDCHRTWEAMYMNCVPIVENNSMNRFFRSLGLPMLLVDEWAEVRAWDETAMEAKYRECREGISGDRLYADYWMERFRLREGRR
jgi:hypothetical protein